jgi:hypothetical protein
LRYLQRLLQQRNHRQRQNPVDSAAGFASGKAIAGFADINTGPMSPFGAFDRKILTQAESFQS